ncbi:phosphatase PAP2 family protein [Gordonia sp. CPCC 205333]|uniref:phosphatase PAP2 family protein n=1 Tax=Gordonia sp. CPCC 205333 TaxID=3140790 RepID=UPI003AF3B4EC
MILEQTSVDVDVYRWVTERRGEPWITLSHTVTFLGNTIPLTIIVVAVVIGLSIRRHYATAVLVGAGSLSGYLLMVALKAIFGRERPPEPDRLIDIGNHSFPSGHSMMSAVCYGLFAVAAFHLSSWVREHRWIIGTAPALAVLIGVSRIYLGVHWLTDVLAGWGIGALWVALCLVIWRWWRSRLPGGEAEPV